MTKNRIEYKLKREKLFENLERERDILRSSAFAKDILIEVCLQPYTLSLFDESRLDSSN